MLRIWAVQNFIVSNWMELTSIEKTCSRCPNLPPNWIIAIDSVNFWYDVCVSSEYGWMKKCSCQLNEEWKKWNRFLVRCTTTAETHNQLSFSFFHIFFFNLWHLNVSIVGGGKSFLLNRLKQLFRTFIEYPKTWIIYFHRLMNEHHSFCLYVSMSMVYSLNLMAPAATNNNHPAISLPNHFKWDTIETNAVLTLQLNELNNSQTHSLTAERIPYHSGHLTNTCFFQSNHQITSNPKHLIQTNSRRAMDIWIDKC